MSFLRSRRRRGGASGRHRWAKTAAVAVVVGVSALVLASALWLVMLLPPADATARVKGLGGPVTVLRDPFAIPHIFARSETDGAFALGYLHAADRLWQMESQRRLAAGRLAEVLGERALASDRTMRVQGLASLVEQQLAASPPEVRAILAAYAAGVNAWIARHRWTLPVEFALLRFRPEPWRPTDPLLLMRLLAMRLSANRGEELLRARLATRLTPEQLADLWPGPVPGSPITYPDVEGAADGGATRVAEGGPSAVLAGDPASNAGPPGGSNLWILDGRRTVSGRPLLANDPHLAFSAPIIWYLARIETPDLSLVGATIPGVPFLIIGHNRHVAWGLTSTHGDVEDVFVEQIDPSDPERYLTPEGSAPFLRREEVIRVRGRAPIHTTVRLTRHGPVISDLMPDAPKVVAGALAGQGPVPAGEYVLALAATYLAPEDRTPEGALRMNRAQDWPAFEAAAALFEAPQQNIGYADDRGHFGLIVAGRMPIRRPGSGQMPRPGWSRDEDWQGDIPFDRHPRSFDPASGRVVNANNRLVGPAFPWDLGRDWDPGFRAQRIEAVLASGGTSGVGDAARLQTDAVSGMAARLLPLLLAWVTEDEGNHGILGMLRAWPARPGGGPTLDADAPEPLIFAAWMRALGPLLYGDELGEDLPSFWGYRSRVIERVLSGRQAWCDDVTTPKAEDCATQVTLALARATDELTARYGSDPRRWRWGEAHRAQLNHGLLQTLPLVAPLVNLNPPLPGGNDTVLQAAVRFADAGQPFAAVHGPGLRMIADLADLLRTRFVIATGQSGYPLSPHYRDQLPLWLEGRALTIAADRAVLARTASGRLRLKPAKGS